VAQHRGVDLEHGAGRPLNQRCDTASFRGSECPVSSSRLQRFRKGRSRQTCRPHRCWRPRPKSSGCLSSDRGHHANRGALAQMELGQRSGHQLAEDERKKNEQNECGCERDPCQWFHEALSRIMSAKAESQADLAPSPAGSPAAAEKRADKKDCCLSFPLHRHSRHPEGR